MPSDAVRKWIDTTAPPRLPPPRPAVRYVAYVAQMTDVGPRKPIYY